MASNGIIFIQTVAQISPLAQKLEDTTDRKTYKRDTDSMAML
jgi:hypothetical protein